MRHWLSGLILLGCAAGISQLRAGLVRASERVKAGTDTYALPGPDMTVLLSLGYRSALADFM
jgi:hypothetical protein